MKKLISLILVLVMIPVVLSGCSNEKDGRDASVKTEAQIPEKTVSTELDPEETVQAEPQELPEETPEAKPAKTGSEDYEIVAADFIRALCAEDFNAVKALLSLGSPEFVTADDIEKGVYGTDFKVLLGLDAEPSVTESSKDYGTAAVDIECGDYTFTVDTVKEDDGTYRVDFSSAYIKDYKVECPKNVTVLIDGYDITGYPAEYLEESVVYTIPCMGYTEKSSSGYTENFEHLGEGTFVPVSGGLLYYGVLSGEDTEPIYEELRVLCNEIFEEYETQQNAVSITSHFAKCSEPAALENVASALDATLETDYHENPSLSYVGPWTLESSKPSIRIVDGKNEIIQINADATKTWKQGDNLKSVNTLLQMRVCYEDGVLKIVRYTLDNPGVFQEDNVYNNMW